MEDKKLYQYTDDFQNLIEFMEENELSYEDMKDTIESIQMSAEDKIKNTGKVIKKLNDDIDLLKKHKKDIDDSIKQTSKKVDNLKQYLLVNMDLMQIDKVQDTTIKVSTRNTPSMVISDETKLPKEFIKEVVEVKPMKQEFTKFYKSLSEEEQAQIKYAEIVYNKSIQIK